MELLHLNYSIHTLFAFATSYTNKGGPPKHRSTLYSCLFILHTDIDYIHICNTVILAAVVLFAVVSKVKLLFYSKQQEGQVFIQK